MKILFLGDYSNLHATYARQLRRMGHQVTVVSDGGSHMATEADILLRRQPGLAGSVKYLFDILGHLSDWRGYDVVQLVNTHFLSLKPGKLAYIFRQLKQYNGRVCLTLAGNDYHFVKQCLQPGFFRYSQFRIGSERAPFSKENRLFEERWTHPRLEKYASLVYENVDAAISTLYEYHVASEPWLGDKLHYVGLPIDLADVTPSPMEFPDGKTVIFIGMVKGREVEKGTDRLLLLARGLETEMPDKCRVVQVSNLPLREYLARMRGSHIVLDQLYSYSPALNALNAMAMGRVAGSGAQPEIYDFIGERELRPVLSLSPLEEGMRDELKHLVLNRDELTLRGHQSREYVERHHDAAQLTARLADIYENLF